MEMAQEIQDRTTIVRGVPIVEPNNKYFWFNRPQWITFLIHFTLFEVNTCVSVYNINLPEKLLTLCHITEIFNFYDSP